MGTYKGPRVSTKQNNARIAATISKSKNVSKHGTLRSAMQRAIKSAPKMSQGKSSNSRSGGVKSGKGGPWSKDGGYARATKGGSTHSPGRREDGSKFASQLSQRQMS